jgi:hypothetical protein
MELSPAAIGIDTGTVLALIAVVTLPIAAIAFARSGPAWRSIGKGPLAIEQDLPPQRSARNAPVSKALQAAEARQMLEAKSYRRQRRGEPPLDVEAEVKRLLDSSATPASPDAELRDEVRRLVIARNERRLRRGQQPLDVEKETERQLADFVGSS